MRLSTFANGQQVRAVHGPTAAVTSVALGGNALVAPARPISRLFLWNAADGK